MAAPVGKNELAGICQYSQFRTFLIILFWVLLTVGSIDVDLINSILCKQCGHTIAAGGDITKIVSELALRQRNDSLFGMNEVFIQTFRNPDKVYFEVITTSKASVRSVNQAEQKYSWFPGFSWQIIVCPECSFHLGWLFRPIELAYDSSRLFYGLILNHITHDLFADSLLVVPKSYRGA